MIIQFQHTYTIFQITKEPDPPEFVRVCNDCGASAIEPEVVKHYATCNPGECQKWEQYYNDIPN